MARPESRSSITILQRHRCALRHELDEVYRQTALAEKRLLRLERRLVRLAKRRQRLC
jgi:hypothetical protein